MSPRLPLLAVCLGYFMVILDATIVNVALPDLRDDLGAGVGALQWVVDGYTLAFAALLLTGGALADRFGARRLFGVGIGLFTAASVACGLAPGIVALVAARVFQGAGAAAMVPASLALLRAAYPDAGTRAKAVGIWGGVGGIGAASGPVLGGLLVAWSGWRGVFFVNVPVALLAGALTWQHVPAPCPDRGRKLDPLAQVMAWLALALLTAALIEGGRIGFSSAPVVAGGLAALVAGALFVQIERRAGHPMLPLGLLGRGTFSGATAVGLLINLGFYGQLFVVNLYFQEVRGYSAIEAGLAVLPQAALVALVSALSGRFTARRGSSRQTMVAGLLAGTAGMAGLLLAGPDTPYPVLIAPLALAGFGMAFTMPAATTAAVEAAPGPQAGIAAGVVNTARQVGGAIGVALLGGLVAGGGFIAGMHVAVALASAAFLAGAAITVASVDRPVVASDASNP